MLTVSPLGRTDRRELAYGVALGSHPPRRPALRLLEAEHPKFAPEP